MVMEQFKYQISSIGSFLSYSICLTQHGFIRNRNVHSTESNSVFTLVCWLHSMLCKYSLSLCIEKVKRDKKKRKKQLDERRSEIRTWQLIYSSEPLQSACVCHITVIRIMLRYEYLMILMLRHPEPHTSSAGDASMSGVLQYPLCTNYVSDGIQRFSFRQRAS